MYDDLNDIAGQEGGTGEEKAAASGAVVTKPEQSPFSTGFSAPTGGCATPDDCTPLSLVISKKI